MKTVFIVGNKFREFSRNDGVITIGEFAEMARTSTFDSLATGCRLVAGQGVREAELQAIHDQARWALSARDIDIGPALRRGARGVGCKRTSIEFRTPSSRTRSGWTSTTSRRCSCSTSDLS